MHPLKTNNEFLIIVKKGLDIAYERMLDYKIMKNSVVVVMRDNKIVHLDPRKLKEEWLNFKKQANCAY
ncbi:MAG: hypothetical protein FGM54_03980 [Chitinophagaceae bacterium]|nr:hypothetical protein [Chitinophagaceae bacterium]